MKQKQETLTIKEPTDYEYQMVWGRAWKYFMDTKSAERDDHQQVARSFLLAYLEYFKQHGIDIELQSMMERDNSSIDEIT